MAFDTYEASQEGSRPIELYTFTIGATINKWTSAEDDVTEGADVFTAINISREKLFGGGTDSQDKALVITVPGDNVIVSQFINAVPGVKANVLIERIQRSDGPTFEVVKIFEGIIDSVAFEKEGRIAKIKLTPLIAAISRPIPRFTYQGLCNHVLYDDRCQVDDTDAAYRLSSAVVTAESANTITVTGADAHGDGYYTGGFVEADGGADHRLILAQVGTLLTLLLPFSDSVLGTSVNVFAGCAHTIAVCKSKFDNVVNFGGFAYVPTKNIFSTGITV